MNAIWKSYRVKRKYYKTLKYYKQPCSVISNPPSVHVYSKSIKPIEYRPKVLWVGTDEGQDYSGLIQGLDKIAEVVVFRRSDGTFGQLRALGSNEANERRENGHLLLTHALDHKVDLVIGQMWAYRMDVDALDHVRSHGIPVVNISMDDRHAYWGRRMKNSTWGGTRGLIGHIDLIATAAPECVKWYQEEGGSAIFWPEASDPDFFHPYPGINKKFDICFVGGKYGIRDRIISSLKKSGLNVMVYGNEWPNGYLPAREVPLLFARSQIVLGIGTIDYSSDFYSLKMRDFDGPMSGSLYLTHANPDLFSLYEIGEEIVVYRNIEECVHLANYYCRNKVEREKIASNGRLRAIREHTWKKRFSYLISNIFPEKGYE